MRLSSRRTDPEYDYNLVKRAIVLLDGVEQNFVVIADEEKGEIVVHVRDERGRLQRAADGSIRTATKTGRVELRFKPKVERV